MAVSFKGVELIETGRYADLKITGRLTRDDYALIVPALDEQIARYGKISLMVELIDFPGWELSAAWEDTRFGLRHFNDIRRLAIVGDKPKGRGMALFYKAFTTARVKYFDRTERDEAFSWLVEAGE